MSTAVDITDWHPERVAGFVEAIRGNHPSIEIEFVLKGDHEGRLSMSLTDEAPTDDFTARQCQRCQTVTVSKVLSLDSLKAPKKIEAAADEHRNGNGPD
jgi:hypothetical protein